MIGLLSGTGIGDVNATSTQGWNWQTVQGWKEGVSFLFFCSVHPCCCVHSKCCEFDRKSVDYKDGDETAIDEKKQKNIKDRLRSS